MIVITLSYERFSKINTDPTLTVIFIDHNKGLHVPSMSSHVGYILIFSADVFLKYKGLLFFIAYRSLYLIYYWLGASRWISDYSRAVVWPTSA